MYLNNNSELFSSSLGLYRISRARLAQRIAVANYKSIFLNQDYSFISTSFKNASDLNNKNSF